jgi:hypothetical protein
MDERLQICPVPQEQPLPLILKTGRLEAHKLLWVATLVSGRLHQEGKLRSPTVGICSSQPDSNHDETKHGMSLHHIRTLQVA